MPKNFMMVLVLLMATSVIAKNNTPGRFGYYVLSLSWSPSFCATKNGRRAKLQCNSVYHFHFVVHGLWPQNQRGWPQNCSKRHNWVSPKIINDNLDIMPSKSLIIHEWRKHGTCSGLSQKQYFKLTRQLFNKIKIPEKYLKPSKYIFTTPQAVTNDFLMANAWLQPSMMALYCGNRRDRANLRELRICFSRQGSAIPCGSNEKRTCRAKRLVLPLRRAR